MEPPLYVALGDSTGVGVGARSGGGYPERLQKRLREDGHTLQLVNLCQSGATTSDLIELQLPRAARTQPRLVTVGIGINDLGLQVPDEAFALGLEEIAVSVARLGAPVALLNLPDLSLSPTVSRLVPVSIYERRVQLFNLHLTATAARHHFLLIDLYRLSREVLPGRHSLFSPDGFHPSAEGYEVWAERMFEPVRALLRGEPAFTNA